MNNKTISFVLGALLIAMGVIFIISPQGAFESIFLVIGVVIIVISAMLLIFSIVNNSAINYYLSSSIFGLIIGIMLVSNTDFAVKFVPIFLGLWLFISGLISTIIMSRNTSSLKELASPITRIVLGIICFGTPIIPISVFGIFIGIVLVLSGINIITNTNNTGTVYKVKVKK
jgi:uncharacterized membrane protein HdeD (DUF308 family)